MNVRSSRVVLALTVCLLSACGDDGSGDRMSSNAATASDGGAAAEPCADGEHQLCLPVQHLKPPVVCHCVAD